jgi:hypothetical protein
MEMSNQRHVPTTLYAGKELPVPANFTLNLFIVFVLLTAVKMKIAILINVTYCTQAPQFRWNMQARFRVKPHKNRTAQKMFSVTTH